jgi:hypothetical protein
VVWFAPPPWWNISTELSPCSKAIGHSGSAVFTTAHRYPKPHESSPNSQPSSSTLLSYTRRKKKNESKQQIDRERNRCKYKQWPDWLWAPPSLLYIDYRGAIFARVKWPGREAGHSPTTTKVKKTWIFISTPPYVFMAQCLIS